MQTSAHRTVPTLLALIALLQTLALGVGGHWHYCFDGNAPAVALHHVADATSEASDVHSEPVAHLDADARASDAAPGKTGAGVGLDIACSGRRTLLALIDGVSFAYRPAAERAARPASHPFRTPWVRGPPITVLA